MVLDYKFNEPNNDVLVKRITLSYVMKYSTVVNGVLQPRAYSAISKTHRVPDVDIFAFNSHV